MTELSTIEKIAQLLGVEPDELDINISESDDTDTTDTEADRIEAAEQRLAKSHPHLTPSERRRYAEQETPGIADFIAKQKKQTPPAHRDNPDVRAILEQRQADREEQRRRATAPIPKPYDEDRPARSNLAPGFMERQADLRRQHDEHVAKVKANHQIELDELAARREADAEASQAVEDQIAALRERRQREDAEAAKRKPNHGHI